MKHAKHTPGPWISNGFHDVGHLKSEIVTQDNKIKVADVFSEQQCWEDPSGRDNANARLIAAAPELLEAVEYAINFLIGFDDERITNTSMFADLKKALAKARGEA